MIICHCLRISDRAIRKTIEEGAETSEQVTRACGAGSCCGGCRESIDEIVCEERGAPKLVFLSFEARPTP